MTIGGNRIKYPGHYGTPTIDLLTVKLHLNSTISTKQIRYMTIDIKDLYLNTLMDRYRYMRLKLTDLPNNVVK